ncbi:SDR family oxidoreductase [Nocardioides dongxiaopingii]|uniref:SDR family oxidoreductase n=1 Tax=Nocardioides sp. S-1144 TaxID=2582905 RepID=UPI00110DE113|nr:SDR family oxidoreductase [Nocardioides sp. S-1144]QCW50066.1 SDR family oxidoreductase [Nocardioides sp. S-1144]
MTLLVTAASGQLGRLVLDSLLDRGVAPAEVRAGARTPDRLAAYAERGLDVVALDYSDPASVEAALVGVDRVLLISGSEVGQRVAQHTTVVDAARAAGVDLLVYTSAPHAREADFVLAPEHRATEEAIEAAGVPATILRNNWYHENYAQALDTVRSTGVLATSAGDGLVASAARADFAEAAAVVLTTDGHAGRVYELGGDVAWDQPTLAAALGEVLGREVAVQQLSTDEHVALLEGVGLDAGTAGFVAGIDTGIRDGVLGDADGTLSRLIGRPTTPLVDGLRALV